MSRGTTWARLATLTAIFTVLAGNWLPSPAQAATVKVSPAFSTPNLKAGFTPQGMTATPSGKLLLAEYKPGSNTRLVNVSTAGKVYGQVSIAPTHAGGIAIVGSWLFVQNADTPDHDTVRAYRMTAINAALKVSHGQAGHPVFVKADHLQELAKWQYASFMTPDGAQLLSGHHGIGTGSRMYRFNVDQATGHLTTVGYVIVPDNTQGVALGGSVFTSGGGKLSIAGRIYAIPSHAEGVAVIGTVAYVAFEHGAKSVGKVQL